MDDEYPQKVLSKIHQDTEHNLKFLAYAIALDSKETFVNYTKWLREVLHNLNFKDEAIIDNYYFIKDALTSFLRDDKLKTAYAYIDIAISQLKYPLVRTPNYITECNPLKEVASQYMTLVLNRNQKNAYDLLKDIRDNHSIKHVYSHILQPTLYEIGRQWQLRKLPLADVHYFSNTTDLFINQLYLLSFEKSKDAKNIITCCIGKETHDIGIKMIAYALSNKGYNNIHLGAYTPVEAVLEVLESQEIHAIIASATMLENVTYLSKLIENIKNQQLDLKVLVGGYAFNTNKNLWKTIQADGYSRDVFSALELLDDLIVS